MKITSGPVLEKAGDLAGLLTSLEPRDVYKRQPQSRLCASTIGYLTAFLCVYILFLFAFAGELMGVMKGQAGW